MRDKRKKELAYAELLAHHLTECLKLDFSAVLADADESTDTIIIDNDKTQHLVQNITSHGQSEMQANINAKRFAENKPFLPAYIVDYEGWILKAVADKVRKNYSNVEELILLIEGSIPAPDPHRIARLSSTINTPFRGIYYVNFPNTQFNSYVVALKKYWDTPKIF